MVWITNEAVVNAVMHVVVEHVCIDVGVLCVLIRSVCGCVVVIVSSVLLWMDLCMCVCVFGMWRVHFRCGCVAIALLM